MAEEVICKHCEQPIYRFSGGWAHVETGETICRYAVAEPVRKRGRKHGKA